MKIKISALILAIALICGSCKSVIIPGISGDDANFILTAYDTDIEDPSMDRRSYYRVYINKTDAGRTTTGLESQEKYFEAKLTPNRHLVKLEKWVLNEKEGRYIKVNNIEQPKPDFIYITISENLTTKVTMRSTRFGNAAFSKVVE
jgi:Tol biopolymer transport system component